MSGVLHGLPHPRHSGRPPFQGGSKGKKSVVWGPVQLTKQLFLSGESWDDFEGEESSPSSLRNMKVDMIQFVHTKIY